MRNGFQVEHFHVENNKVVLTATAPTQHLKDQAWDQIKKVDPTFTDLQHNITLGSGTIYAWPIGTDARLTEAEALAQLGRHEGARKILDAERMVISKHRDNPRMDRWRALSRGERLSFGNGDAKAAAENHLQIAERAIRAGRPKDALEHYRSARTLLEA